MFDLNSIKDSNQKTDKNTKLSREPEEFLKQGIELLKAFSVSRYDEDLKNALKSLFKYIEVNKNNPEPFFYIALSAYLLDDKHIAGKYLAYTEQLSPSFPYLSELKILLMK